MTTDTETESYRTYRVINVYIYSYIKCLLSCFKNIEIQFLGCKENRI